MSKAKATEKVVEKKKQVLITPPNTQVGVFTVEHTAPYLQLRFSKKAKAAMREAQEAGEKKAKKKKPARDFEADYHQSYYITADGKYGMPASGIRASMVRACKLAGFAMTDAKVTLFVLADDFDKYDETPLVYLEGTPKPHLGHVRNANGSADLRMRAIWTSWKMTVRIKYDADIFDLDDVANILARAAEFVGWGEGRPDSKKSAGMGYGTGRVVTRKELKRGGNGNGK